MESEQHPLDHESLRLSVVMAAYNEERTIEAIVDRVRAVPLRIEIVAVNDASRDGTGAVLDLTTL